MFSTWDGGFSATLVSCTILESVRGYDVHPVLHFSTYTVTIVGVGPPAVHRTVRRRSHSRSHSRNNTPTGKRNAIAPIFQFRSRGPRFLFVSNIKMGLSESIFVSRAGLLTNDPVSANASWAGLNLLSRMHLVQLASACHPETMVCVVCLFVSTEEITATL